MNADAVLPPKGASSLYSAAATAAQQYIRSIQGVSILTTGHWGTYSHKTYLGLSAQGKSAVDVILGAFGLTEAVLFNATPHKVAPVRSGTPAKNSYFETVVLPTVTRRAQALGFLNPKLAGAQLALESANGRKLTGRNNYGGIKAARGEPSTNVATHEIIAGVEVAMRAQFKDYNTAEDFIDDYLMSLIRKWPGTVKAKTGSEWAYALKHGVGGDYFTSNTEKYAMNLTSIASRLT